VKASTKSPHELQNIEVIGMFTAAAYAEWTSGAALFYKDKSERKCLAPHFVRIYGARAAFRAGFELVLYSDLDAHFNLTNSKSWHIRDFMPRDAHFATQKEPNLCSGVWIARTESAEGLLDMWQQRGTELCCTQHTFDQISYKQVLFGLAAGDPEKYYSAVCVEPSPPSILEEQETVNGLHLHHNASKQLHNCGNRWGGCIDPQNPALLDHYGHDALHERPQHYLRVALDNANLFRRRSDEQDRM
jgi:hypothetical protein